MNEQNFQPSDQRNIYHAILLKNTHARVILLQLFNNAKVSYVSGCTLLLWANDR